MYYETLSKKFEENPVGNTCLRCQPQGTDVIIVVDASQSIGRTDWNLQKEFVTNYVKKQKFGDKEDETRVAIVFFSQQVGFCGFRAMLQHQERNGHAVDGCYQFFSTTGIKGYQTYTHEAIKAARNVFLTDASSRIKNGGIRRVLLVLTDGQATYPGPLKESMAKFREAVRNLLLQ